MRQGDVDLAPAGDAPVTEQAPLRLADGADSRNWASVGVLACTSLVILGHEVLLTRVFAVVTFSVHSFAAIGIALLGTGGGALLTYCTRPERDRAVLLDRQLAALSALALSIPLTIYARLQVEFVPQDMAEAASEAAVTAFSASQRLALLRNAPELFHAWKFYAVLPLACAPFLLGGYLQAITLRFAPRRFGSLYAADLVGCSAGALLGPLVLHLCGLAGTLAAFALLLLVPAGLACAARRGSLPARASALLALAAVLALPASGRLEVRYPAGFREKEVQRSYWSPMGRVALLQNGTWDMYVIDNSSRTSYAPRTEETRRLYEDSLYASAMRMKRGGELLVIASGGGQEVAMGSWYAMAHIDAVEIAEPIVWDIVHARREDPGNPYLLPGVTVHVADGRSVAMRSRRPYDMIQMLEVNYHTLAGRISEAWSPDLALTQEAFAEYLRTLKPDGYVCYTSFMTNLRPLSGKMGCLFRSMVAGMRLAGIAEPEKHVVVLYRQYLYGYRVMAMLKPTPFSPWEIATLRDDMARQLQLYGRPYGVLYAPDARPGAPAAIRVPLDEPDEPAEPTPRPLPRSPQADQILEVITATRPAGSGPASIFRVKAGRDAPLTDECPYMEGSGLLRSSERYGQLIGSTYRIMITAFLALLGLLVAGPYLLQRRRGARLADICGWRLLPVIALTGAGFMLIEMSAIYRYQLYLHHPTIAMALVLGTLTLGAGLGSLHTEKRLAAAGGGAIAGYSAAAAAAAAAVLVLAPATLHDLFLRTPLWLLAPAVGLACCALGYLLGHVVPLGLARFARDGQAAIPLGWALSTFAGVGGTVAASILARDIGMSVVTWAGVACYACLAAATGIGGRGQPAAGLDA